MRIIAFSTLRTYWASHADAEDALREWYDAAEAAEWKSPNQIKEYAASASILANNRVCFNIKGNQFRLIAGVNYEIGFVYIKWVGTHAEYDKIDAETVEYRKRG